MFDSLDSPKKKRKINVDFNVDFWCQINQSSTRTTMSYVFSWKWVTCRRFMKNINEWVSWTKWTEHDSCYAQVQGRNHEVFFGEATHVQKRHNFQKWLCIMWGFKKENYITITSFRMKWHRKIPKLYLETGFDTNSGLCRNL